MTKEFTEDEMKEILVKIAEPTFKFLLKRINTKILDDETVNKMSLSCFLSILCGALALIDANALRWMENFHELQSGKKLDFDKLRMIHTKNLYKQLESILQ